MKYRVLMSMSMTYETEIEVEADSLEDAEAVAQEKWEAWDPEQHELLEATGSLLHLDDSGVVLNEWRA